MIERDIQLRKILRRESVLLAGLLFVGIVLLPVAVYLIGDAVFGAYGGYGYSDFFGALNGRLRNGDWVAWFLVLSPYLGTQCLRLSVELWRAAGTNAPGR